MRRAAGPVEVVQGDTEDLSESSEDDLDVVDTKSSRPAAAANPQAARANGLGDGLSASQRALLLNNRRGQAEHREEEQETHPLAPSMQADQVGDGPDLLKQLPGEGGEMTMEVVGFEAKHEALSCGVSPDGELIAVGFRNGNFTVYNAENLEVVSTVDYESMAACTSVRFRPDIPNSSTRNVVIAGQGDTFAHYHASTGKLLRAVQEEDNSINIVGARSDGEWCATAGSDGVVRVYDETRQVPVVRLSDGNGTTTAGHSNSIFGLCWRPADFQVLLTGGWDRTVQIWDLRVGRSVRSLRGPYICGDALDTVGSSIVTGSWRHGSPLQVWDYGSGRLTTNLPFWQPEPEACMLYATRLARPSVVKGVAAAEVWAGGSGPRPCARLYKLSGELRGTIHFTSAVHAIDTRGDMTAVCCAFQLATIRMPTAEAKS